MKLPMWVASVAKMKILVTGQSFYQVNKGTTPKTENSATIFRSSTLADYPDLTVDGLTINPPAPVSGGSLTMSWRDGNHGSAAVATSFSDHLTVVNQTTGGTLYDSSVAFDPPTAGSGPV